MHRTRNLELSFPYLVSKLLFKSVLSETYLFGGRNTLQSLHSATLPKAENCISFNRKWEPLKDGGQRMMGSNLGFRKKIANIAISWECAFSY